MFARHALSHMGGIGIRKASGAEVMTSVSGFGNSSLGITMGIVSIVGGTYYHLDTKLDDVKKEVHKIELKLVELDSTLNRIETHLMSQKK